MDLLAETRAWRLVIVKKKEIAEWRLFRDEFSGCDVESICSFAPMEFPMSIDANLSNRLQRLSLPATRTPHHKSTGNYSDQLSEIRRQHPERSGFA